MRPINLLPPEAYEAVRARRLRRLLAVAGVVYLGLLVLVTFAVQGRVDDAEATVQAQRETNAELQRTVARLSDSEGLIADYETGRTLLAEALAKDVSWSTLMVDLSRQIPDRLWLDGFSGTTEVGDGLGRLTISGIAFDFQDVSEWLRSLNSERFPGVTGTWVDSISEATFNEFEVVAFSSTTNLTDAARSNRLAARTPELAR